MVDIVAWGLFVFLEGSVAKTLKWLYPARPQQADEWLAYEIARAAADPRSLDVFKVGYDEPIMCVCVCVCVVRDARFHGLHAVGLDVRSLDVSLDASLDVSKVKFVWVLLLESSIHLVSFDCCPRLIARPCRSRQRGPHTTPDGMLPRFLACPQSALNLSLSCALRRLLYLINKI